MDVRHFFKGKNPLAATPVPHNGPPKDNCGVASFQCHGGDSSQKLRERQLQNSTFFELATKGSRRNFEPGWKIEWRCK
jgi:hypothetical protein